MNSGYAPDAFGFVNVIFFTLKGGDVSVARRGLPAPFRPREEYSQRFAASRRFAFKDLNETSMAHAGTCCCVTKETEQSECTAKTGHGSHNRYAHSRSIYTFRHQAMESWAEGLILGGVHSHGCP
jgi:hypothetical protein